MKWFLVALLFDPSGGPNQPVPSLSDKDYRTRIECQNDSVRRIFALQSVGAHGRWLCMHEGQSDASLAREQKFEF